MSNSNRIICIYTEGETDDVFYNRVLEYIKDAHSGENFHASRIEKKNLKGIGNFQNKVVRKFGKEVVISKNENLEKIVILCYDQDVFELTTQTPPIDREKMHKDLYSAGATKVVDIIAKQCIEDVFLVDEESILRTLHLKKCKISGRNGYERMMSIYGKAHKVYLKGSNVEKFVYELDIGKICRKHPYILDLLSKELYQ